MAELIYEGTCHCGAIGYRYGTAIDPVNWPIRACQCGFCRMHDALSTSDPLGTLQFSATSEEILQRYRFALKTADFLICRRCGVYVGAVIDTAEGKFGIINTHTLDKAPRNVAEGSPISYDIEDEEARIRRREERWTPVTGVPWHS